MTTSTAGTGRTRQGSMRVAVALILLLPLLVFLMAGTIIWASQDQARDATEARIEAAANLAVSRIKLVVTTDLQLLRQFDDGLGVDPAAFVSAAVTGQRQGQNGLVGAAYILVFDTEGFVRLPGGLDIGRFSIARRDYFQDLAKGAEWKISPLIIPEAQGEKVFAISRRLERNGAFVGAAVIYVPADVLSDDWATAGLGANSTLGLLREDGQLIARFPVPDQGLDMSDYELFTEHLPKSPSGIYSTVSPLDGVARMVAYRKVDTLPVIAVGSISSDLVEQGYWRQAWSTAAMTAPIWLTLLGVCGWMILLLRRNERSRAALETALAENKVLLQEIHHRVKNNLQMVSAMVSLQPVPATVKEDLNRRITAMSAVHQHMYESDQFGSLDVSDYLAKLVAGLQAGHDGRVILETRLESLVLPSEKALPLGLIVNEVVSNAFKHAFPDGAAGTVGVDLKVVGREAVLTIRDSGAGYTPGGGRTGMGTRLIAGLVQQMGGTHTTIANGGTVFEMKFPAG